MLVTHECDTDSLECIKAQFWSCYFCAQKHLVALHCLSEVPFLQPHTQNCAWSGFNSLLSQVPSQNGMSPHMFCTFPSPSTLSHTVPLADIPCSYSPFLLGSAILQRSSHMLPLLRFLYWLFSSPAQPKSYFLFWIAVGLHLYCIYSKYHFLSRISIFIYFLYVYVLILNQRRFFLFLF